ASCAPASIAACSWLAIATAHSTRSPTSSSTLSGTTPYSRPYDARVRRDRHGEHPPCGEPLHVLPCLLPLHTLPWHGLFFHQAVCCLLQADANLVVNTQCQGPDTSVKDAFLTAATTALHPNPDAKVNLLTLCKAMMGSEALPMMQGGKQLFSDNIHRLVMLLSPGSSPRAHEDPPLPPLSLTGWSLGELS
ncbi:Os10g0448000, partial [Oryza sativa Japonica Group]